ncbi:hypothetical protein L4C34_07760 [Vibrio profundum]|uniref:hypothetical protein n=1 Tax=Vibrio profundum TaxID=2910247 RepID=UPI003D0971DF
MDFSLQKFESWINRHHLVLDVIYQSQMVTAIFCALKYGIYSQKDRSHGHGLNS